MNTEHADQPISTITFKLPAELLEYVDKTIALEGPDTWAIINRFVRRGLLTSKAVIKRMEFQNTQRTSATSKRGMSDR